MISKAKILSLMPLIFCVLMLCIAYFLEHHYNLQPCSLCILTRWVVFGLLILYLSQLIVKKLFYKLGLGVLAIFLNIGGLSIAARHLWIQNLPAEQVPECTPSLNYLLENYPFLEVMQVVLKGSGECSTQSFIFLGGTIPFWNSLSFIALGLFGIYSLYAIKKG